jgi:tetratricopeptide (TPR) repeat protein
LERVTLPGEDRPVPVVGKDAMAMRTLAPSQSWQLPLLLFSLALFGYAGYLFIDPKPAETVDQQLAVARALLRQDRGEATIEVLNKLTKIATLTKPQQGDVHLMLARALEVGQREKKVDLITNHEQIVRQTQLARQNDVILAADDYRRLATSHAQLGNRKEAVDGFRVAMSLDPQHELAMHRRVIELLADDGDKAAAGEELDKYLAVADLQDAERGWALGAKAQLLIDEGRFAESRSLLDQAEKLAIASDRTLQGELAYRLGYAASKVGDNAEAERYFLNARDLLGVKHALDADAAYALGRIALGDRRFDQAIAYLQAVIVSHPDSPLAPLARMERGKVRATRGEVPASLDDFAAVVKLVIARPHLAKAREPVLQTLRDVGTIFENRGDLDAAIEVMGHETALEPKPETPFFARLANVLERRAKRYAEEAERATGADKVKLAQNFRDAMTRAGAAYIAVAQRSTLADDTTYAESLWKGVDCFDRAGDAPASVNALELFIAERPDDPLAPDALLRLGRTYQAAGLFDKAISTFQRNQLRYPNSLAASKSGVPLAQAYMAKGPESYPRAEQVLTSVIDNNPLLTPESAEFRQAVFELGQLMYRTGRYEEAIARLEEFNSRYADDPRRQQVAFVMADAYRKNAAAIGDRLALLDAGKLEPTAGGKLVDRVELVVSRRDRLRKARSLFEHVIDASDGELPTAEIDQLYLKLAHFYRADCLFDLNEFDESIKLYDVAARRYQNDPSALAAYVQIVNAYVALNRPDDARAANERAKWMLRRIPPDAFAQAGTFNISKQYWEQWLGFAGESGLLAKQLAATNGK